MHNGLPVKVYTPFSRGTDDGVAGGEEGGEGGEGGVRAGTEEDARVRSGKRALEREVVATSGEGGRVGGAEVEGRRVVEMGRVDVGTVVEDDEEEGGGRVSPSVEGEREVSGGDVGETVEEGKVKVGIRRSESSWSWKKKEKKKKNMRTENDGWRKG